MSVVFYQSYVFTLMKTSGLRVSAPAKLLSVMQMPMVMFRYVPMANISFRPTVIQRDRRGIAFALQGRQRDEYIRRAFYF